MKRQLILILFALLLFASAVHATHSQHTQSDSTTIVFSFHASSDAFYIPYKGNDGKLEQLLKIIDQNKTSILNEQIPIYVTGYSVALATKAENLALAKVRANRVKSELISRQKLKESNFLTTNYATAYQDKQSVVIVKIILPSKELKKQESPSVASQPETQTTQPETQPEKVATIPIDIPIAEPEPPATHKPLNLSVHTNLLYWAMATPNLGIEYGITNDVSILISGAWSNWKWKDKERQHKITLLNPELRYHMGANKQWYVGAEFHTGKFNLKLSDTRRKGDYIGAGITSGYKLKLNRQFGIDFNLGLGCTHLDYDKTVLEIPAGSKNKNIWGISQAGINLVWKPF